MREFVTAASAVEAETGAESTEESKWNEFEVVEKDKEGKEVKRVLCRAQRPSPAQIAYLTASLHKHAPLETQLAGGINFVMAIMDQESSGYLSDRLLASDDPFDIPDLQAIIMGLVEEWSGKATEQSLSSAPTP